MTIESVTYIDDLNASYPAGTDVKSEGDNHIRNIKTAIKATFPSIDGPVTTTQAELNILDGATVTTAELNVLDGVTATAAKLNAPTSGTATATTSGTSIDFGSIPSWAKRIVISFVGVSTSGTSNMLVRIGDAGGIETTGYDENSTYISGPDTCGTGSAITSGFEVGAADAGAARHGHATLVLVDAATNTWSYTSLVYVPGIANVWAAGTKSLSAALDRLSITTVGGTDTFDAGKVNILYD